MLLTIHNLPVTTRYADIKSLLQSKCGLQHVILDNLIGDGATKKVTVGVAEDADAAILVRKINGLYWNGQQLYVEDVRQQKTASDQPFRSSNPQLQQMEPSFNATNLQQHSSFSQMASNMAQSTQPLMAAMYCVPNFTNQNYVRPDDFGQNNYMQPKQNFQLIEKMQNAYMAASGFPQNATPYSQFGMTSQYIDQQDVSQSEAQGSGWVEDYDEDQDFAAKKPQFRRQSPENREVNWYTNQQRQESPSREGREQPWTQGSGNHGPTQPDFRSTIRKTQPDFRSTIRPDERSGFGKPRPEFRPDEPHDRHEKPDRPEFGNDQGRPNQFSRRPNEFSGRPIERQERDNEFSIRPNEFYRRPNERERGPNVFSERSNDFSRRPIERQERENEFSSRPSTLARRVNERQESQNARQGRPNERQGPSNERPQLGRSNERPQFGRSNERPMFSRGDLSERGGKSNRGQARSVPSNSRKRKFEETHFEHRGVDRPERLSRPDNWPQQPPFQSRQLNAKKPERKHFLVEAASEPLTEAAKAKFDKNMRFIGIRLLVSDIKTNLGINDLDLNTRQQLKKVVTERVEKLLGDRTLVDASECFNTYRTKYSKTSDATTYNLVLGLVAQQMAEEAKGKNKEIAKTKPIPFIMPKPKPLIPKRDLIPPRVTKAERLAMRNYKEAKNLMAQGKVPTFPQGNKKLVAQHKKEEKECHIPEVQPTYKKAIEDELNPVIDMFVREIKYAPNESLQMIYDTVDKDELTTEIRKLLTQSLSRRVSNSGLKVLRIYGCPILPKRASLEKFLLRYGVQSLRKSEKSKMYTAAIDTYKNYDYLCQLEKIQVGVITVTFKPFHVAPKQRANQALLKVQRKKNINSMIEHSDLNLLDKDWPAKEAEIKAKEAEKQAASEAKLAAEAEKKAAQAENEAAQAEEQAEKQAEDVSDETKDNNELDKEKVDLIKGEPNKEINEYLNEDFHVIDEVNDSDSDVEYIAEDIRVVNVDDDINEDKNDGGNNGVENDDGGMMIENDDDEIVDKELEGEDFSADFDIDNVDVDIDDINDDDLEDY